MRRDIVSYGFLWERLEGGVGVWGVWKFDVHGGFISLHRIRMYKAPRLIDRRVFALDLVLRKRPRMTSNEYFFSKNIHLWWYYTQRTSSRHASGAHSCGMKRTTSGITTNIISSVMSRDLGGGAGLHPSASSQLCKQPSTYLMKKKNCTHMHYTSVYNIIYRRTC